MSAAKKKKKSRETSSMSVIDLVIGKVKNGFKEFAEITLGKKIINEAAKV